MEQDNLFLVVALLVLRNRPPSFPPKLAELVVPLNLKLPIRGQGSREEATMTSKENGSSRSQRYRRLRY